MNLLIEKLREMFGKRSITASHQSAYDLYNEDEMEAARSMLDRDEQDKKEKLMSADDGSKFQFNAKILADSLPTIEGVGRCSHGRLTTMELTYPRCIHAEFMTHRMFSRNSASSRAIPVEKMLQRITQWPFIPINWGKNQKGMQAGEELHEDQITQAIDVWLKARDAAVARAWELHELGLHKQLVNRITEPWMWITVIATGITGAWENFFKLRCHPDAEPHIQRIAYMARDLYDSNTPKELQPGEWHLPLVGFEGDENIPRGSTPQISTARCARVSYLTHDGHRDLSADFELFERLRTSGHWSPFEHPARVRGTKPEECREGIGGNFGLCWIQYRKLFQGEYCEKAPR